LQLVPRLSAAFLLFALAACRDAPDGAEELKLRHRDKDAGPAVVVVDQAGRTQLPQSDEKEPNDAKSGGQVIVVPAAIRGQLDPPGDWDVFVVKVPKAGTLSVKLSAVDGVDMALEIQAEDGELLVTSDNGGVKVAEAIPNLFVQPSPYRIVVHTAPPKKDAPAKGRSKKGAPDAGIVIAAPPIVVYLLEVSIGPVPAAGQEREMNDEASFAEDLALGATGQGYLGWRRDVDLWKIPLAEVQDDESLSVDVDGIPEVALRVAVVGEDGKARLERRGKTGEAVALRGLGARAGEPALYVSVSGDRSSEEPYSVRAQAGGREPDDEVEPNDGVAAANPLVATRTGDSGQRTGTIGRGDVDLFRLEPAPVARLLTLRIDPPSGVDVDLVVLGGDGKSALSGAASAGKKGEAESLTQVPIAANQTAYVKVIGKAGETTEEKYELGWALEAGETQ
jgi:hypothetical protein